MSTQGAKLLPPFMRYVTGHNEQGQSVHIRKDLVHTEPLPGSTIKDPMKVIYTTSETPADNSSPFVDPMMQTVPSLANGNGTVVRFVDFLPDTQDVRMHRTSSIDYGFVLSGSIFHGTEDGDEVELKAGDVMIQRGTSHAWRNASKTEYCRMVFILVAAHPVEVGGKKLSEVGFTPKEFEQPGDVSSK